MNRRLLTVVLVVCGCGTSQLELEPGEPGGTTQDELAVGHCFQSAADPLAFLDGGVDRLQACLADAGITSNLPPLPAFDAGLPPLPAFDAGLPPLPAFDAGLPPLPAFDAGLPPLPTFDAGVDLSNLLAPCSAGCSCPGSLRCLNPLGQTCPGTLTMCVP